MTLVIHPHSINPESVDELIKNYCNNYRGPSTHLLYNKLSFVKREFIEQCAKEKPFLFGVKEIYVFLEDPSQVPKVFNLIKKWFNLKKIPCVIYCNAKLNNSFEEYLEE